MCLQIGKYRLFLYSEVPDFHKKKLPRLICIARVQRKLWNYILRVGPVVIFSEKELDLSSYRDY